MAFIKIHQDRITDRAAAKALCPFGALTEDESGALEIGAGCRMCRVCLRRGGGAFEFVDDAAPGVDKSQWRGVAVVAETDPEGRHHPVGLELLGKARELFEEAVKDSAVIYMNSDVFYAEFSEGSPHDAEDFKITGGAVASYSVDVTLNEFAVAAGLWFFSAPYFCDVVTFERKVKLAFVLCGESCERNCEVESQRYVTLSVVEEAENLFFCLSV